MAAWSAESGRASGPVPEERWAPGGRRIGRCWVWAVGPLLAACVATAPDPRDLFSTRPDAADLLADYTAKPHHKAMAVAADGAAVWAHGQTAPGRAVDAALALCARDHDGCTLYRIGDITVPPEAGRAAALALARDQAGGAADLPETDAAARRVKIQSLLAWEQAEAARAVADAWVGAEPEAGLAHAYRGWTLASLGDTDGALEASARGVALLPDNAWAQVRHGDDLAAAVRFDAALARYARALDIDPALEAAQAGRHRVLTALGRHADARDAAAAVLDARPELVPAYIRKAQAESRLGRPDDALTTLAAAYAVADDDATLAAVAAAEADILLLAGRLQPAVDAVVAAGSGTGGPGTGGPGADVLAGRLLAASGCVAAARARLETVIDTPAAPQGTAAAAMLAQALADILARAGDDPDRAVALARMAAGRPTADGMAGAVLGWALFRSGDAEAAETVLEAARIRLPGNAVVAGWLGTVYGARNRADEAEALLYETLARTPGGYPEALAIARLDGGAVPNSPDPVAAPDADTCAALAARLAGAATPDPAATPAAGDEPPDHDAAAAKDRPPAQER